MENTPRKDKNFVNRYEGKIYKIIPQYIIASLKNIDWKEKYGAHSCAHIPRKDMKAIPRLIKGREFYMYHYKNGDEEKLIFEPRGNSLRDVAELKKKQQAQKEQKNE